MRALKYLALLAPLALAACGGEDRTVVVNPAQPAPAATTYVAPAPPASHTIVTPSGTVTRVCPAGAITC